MVAWATKLFYWFLIEHFFTGNSCFTRKVDSSYFLFLAECFAKVDKRLSSQTAQTETAHSIE